MTPEQVFSISGPVAMAGWLMLIFASNRQWARVAAGFGIPILLSAAYLLLVASHWKGHAGGFGSLAQVRLLFSNDWLLLAGWIHYLAFDLFIGAWETRDSEKSRLSLALVIPCLVLTFLFGPIGLMCYFAIRSTARRRPTLSSAFSGPAQ